ncbi:unnamed protein product [Vicia faba]|uniref:Uncharacterized protein n=1 Tax=Vicia faba TaxID=3906 RepID=A0AAV1AXQ3_VICFA|nr:unnamed protein product [Vicia faba]
MFYVLVVYFVVFRFKGMKPGKSVRKVQIRSDRGSLRNQATGCLTRAVSREDAQLWERRQRLVQCSCQLTRPVLEGMGEIMIKSKKHRLTRVPVSAKALEILIFGVLSVLDH